MQQFGHSGEYDKCFKIPGVTNQGMPRSIKATCVAGVDNDSDGMGGGVILIVVVIVVLGIAVAVLFGMKCVPPSPRRLHSGHSLPA